MEAVPSARVSGVPRHPEFSGSGHALPEEGRASPLSERQSRTLSEIQNKSLRAICPMRPGRALLIMPKFEGPDVMLPFGL